MSMKNECENAKIQDRLYPKTDGIIFAHFQLKNRCNVC